MSGQTLEEALATGEGIERPFRCPEHDDQQASASVNVLKGVWFCHACFARGRVGDKRAPRAADLAALLEPEKSPRVYPEAWLELFDLRPGDGHAYWRQRFAPWVCWLLGLGSDPFTGEATFPVHTPAGRLAGVGRRSVEEKAYRYPKGWAASTQLGGTRGHITPVPVLAIVEGMADAAACLEVGATALCQWGSQLHAPQVEMVARFNPRLILLGQDMDEAGERGVSLAFKQLHRVAPLVRVHWYGNDPADRGPVARRTALETAVGRSTYGVDVIPQWDAVITNGVAMYERAMEESG